MNSDSRIFAFETDFAGTLRCIPMAVRFRLDLCGVKVSLRQWSRLSREDRARLLSLECGSTEQIGAYRQVLTGLIEARTGAAATLLEIEPRPEWSDSQRVPDEVRETASALSLQPPTVGQWAALDPLQRFALVKLARGRHDRNNFVPAMREFGLVG